MKGPPIDAKAELVFLLAALVLRDGGTCLITSEQRRAVAGAELLARQAPDGSVTIQIVSPAGSS
jgi:hypothetical protein